MNMPIKSWYSTWFNTPFYHVLYQDRNYEEAQVFMDNLTHYLKLPKTASILDLACGKGRHSIYLNQLGYRVLGVDLSEKSIAEAKTHETDTLRFKVHDMRNAFPEKFDAVFNLFTSFGYFENENDNIKTIKAIQKELKNTGFAVIDFLNITYLKKHLVPENTKVVNGISFLQKRKIENNYIIKDIYFTHQEKKYHFQERVQALTLDDFKRYIKAANLQLLKVFGSYTLENFNPETSKRLLLIFN